MANMNRRDMLWILGAAGLWIPSACGASGRGKADAAPTARPAAAGAGGTYAYQAYIDEAGGDRANGGAGDACAETEDNIEGPYYRRGAPWKDDLAAGRKGTKLVVNGVVSGADCKPLAGAILDVWQADDAGHYDNDGSKKVDHDVFELRGRVKTGVYGQYSLTTIVPGRYLLGENVYRPAHIHVKVAAAAHRTLTTQLYFPDDPWNDKDPFIKPSLIMKVTKDSDTLVGQFDFVLAAA